MREVAERVLERWPEFQKRFQAATPAILRLKGDAYRVAAEDAALFASDARKLARAYLEADTLIRHVLRHGKVGKQSERRLRAFLAEQEKAIQ